MSRNSPSVAGARLCLVLAALLWSLGSVFMRVLREPLGLGLDTPTLTPLQIAFYRGLFVVLFLRVLRDCSSAWLVALNLLGGAFALGLFVLVNDGPTEFLAWVTAPSAKQLAVLFVFGALQMAFPYWLFARGVRTVSPQE